METKRTKWHLWLLALAMAVLLAACGSDDQNKAAQAGAAETEATDQQEDGSQVDFLSWMNYGIMAHHRKISDVLRILA